MSDASSAFSRIRRRRRLHTIWMSRVRLPKLQKIFRQYFCDSNVWISSPSSPQIFAVRPNNLELRLPVLTIPTPYLSKTLLTAVSHQAAAQQHLIFMMLTAHPSLGTAAGWWFEIMHTLGSPIRLVPLFKHISAVFQTPPPFPLPRLCWLAQMRFAKFNHHLIFIGESPSLRVLMVSFVSGTQSESCSTPHFHPIDRQPRASRRFARL